MKIIRNMIVSFALLACLVLTVLTIRACANTRAASSDEFERSIREIVDGNLSIQDVFVKNRIGEINYTGREPGRYNNGIAFFELKDRSSDELLIYWSLDRTAQVYIINRLVLRNGFNLNIIWEQ